LVLQRLIDCYLDIVFGSTRALVIRNSSSIGKAAFPRYCMPIIRVLSSTWNLAKARPSPICPSLLARLLLRSTWVFLFYIVRRFFDTCSFLSFLRTNQIYHNFNSRFMIILRSHFFSLYWQPFWSCYLHLTLYIRKWIFNISIICFFL